MILAALMFAVGAGAGFSVKGWLEQIDQSQRASIFMRSMMAKPRHTGDLLTQTPFPRLAVFSHRPLVAER